LDKREGAAPQHPRAVRLLLLFVAVTAVLSLLYAGQYFLGSPVRLQVTSAMRDLALYPAGTLKYASQTSRGWEFQVVDSGANMGQYTALVLDSSGNPHVSFYDVTDSALKYARWTGSAWDIQTVDADGDVGRFTSLVLDSRGRPHISYCLYDPAAQACQALKYASYDGAAWVLTTVDSPGVGEYSSLRLDSLDNPHIAYQDNGNSALKYAHRRIDGTWEFQVVDSGAGVGEYASLVLAGGRPRIAYYNRAQGDLRFAVYVGSNGNCGPEGTTYLFRVGPDSVCDLDKGALPAGLREQFERAGRPLTEQARVEVQQAGVHWTIVDADRKYSIRSENQALNVYDTTWDCQVVDNTGDVGQYLSLALDSSRRPAIGYYDAGRQVLKYAHLSGTAWLSETVDASPQTGLYTSLALDTSGHPHISYYDAAQKALKYASWTGQEWELQTVDNAGTTGQYASLVLDSAGDPHISYYEASAQVAAASDDGTIYLWTVRKDWSLRTFSAQPGPVLNVAFDPSGRMLFSAYGDGTVRLWNVASGQVERTIAGSAGGSPLTSMAVSADGSTLATLGQDGVVRVWDIASGLQLQTIISSGASRRAIALSADGALLATGNGADIQLWYARSGQPVAELKGYWQDETTKDVWLGHLRDVTALAFSPDGKNLASGGDDAVLVFWDVATGKVLGTVARHWSPVTKVVFSADGTYFLSGSQDAKALSGKPATPNVVNFEGHLGSVNGVAFGREADTLLTAGDDGTVRYYNAQSGSAMHLEWPRPGLLPMWGSVLVLWMLFSGVAGLAALWGLWRGQRWGHLLALGLYLIGPLLVLGVPVLELPSYPDWLAIGPRIAWPLLALGVWYAALVVVLTRSQVAVCYETSRAVALAQQLMARRRTLQLRFGLYAGAVWIAVLVILYAVLRRFTLDVAFMQHYFSFIMEGAGKTLYISAVSIALAVILALLGALGRLSNNPIPNGVSGFYVSLIRGTPLLVQIYIWYLGLPQLGIVLDAELAGFLALGVNYGAYMTEIFRAGIQAIGKGQYEAAQALGMSGAQTFRRIVLPQAFRIVIPPIGNEFIAMMKDSSLVSVMGVWELTFRAQRIGRQYFRSIETFLIAAAFYWILTVIFQFLQGKLETYMARSERK
jgi:polar amino acid transport system permease protein